MTGFRCEEIRARLKAFVVMALADVGVLLIEGALGYRVLARPNLDCKWSTALSSALIFASQRAFAAAFGKNEEISIRHLLQGNFCRNECGILDGSP
jgi:hypothetical protein